MIFYLNKNLIKIGDVYFGISSENITYHDVFILNENSIGIFIDFDGVSITYTDIFNGEMYKTAHISKISKIVFTSDKIANIPYIDLSICDENRLVSELCVASFKRKNGRKIATLHKDGVDNILLNYFKYEE
jgi:hypothetical protein